MDVSSKRFVAFRSGFAYSGFTRWIAGGFNGSHSVPRFVSLAFNRTIAADDALTVCAADCSAHATDEVNRITAPSISAFGTV